MSTFGGEVLDTAGYETGELRPILEYAELILRDSQFEGELEVITAELLALLRAFLDHLPPEDY